MPVYEFLCEGCNRVFSFLARDSKAARRRPKCPKCGGRRMTKLFSPFATARGGRGEKDSESGGGAEPAEAPSPQQEARLERAMESIEQDMDSLDENNPRQMAALMRRLSEAAGEPMDAATDEMIRRLEAGEDADKIEEEMADALGDEESPGGRGAPSRDEGLYDL